MFRKLGAKLDNLVVDISYVMMRPFSKYRHYLYGKRLIDRVKVDTMELTKLKRVIELVSEDGKITDRQKERLMNRIDKKVKQAIRRGVMSIKQELINIESMKLQLGSRQSFKKGE